MVITHSGVTDDLQGAENPKPPFDDNCSYLEDGHIRRGQNVFDPEKREKYCGSDFLSETLTEVWSPAWSYSCLHGSAQSREPLLIA